MNFRILLLLLLFVFEKNQAQEISTAMSVNIKSVVCGISNSSMKIKKPKAFEVLLKIKNTSSTSGTITVRLQSTAETSLFYSKTIKLKKKTTQLKFKKVPYGTYKLSIIKNNMDVKEGFSKVLNQDFYIHSDVTKIIELKLD